MIYHHDRFCFSLEERCVPQSHNRVITCCASVLRLARGTLGYAQVFLRRPNIIGNTDFERESAASPGHARCFGGVRVSICFFTCFVPEYSQCQDFRSAIAFVAVVDAATENCIFVGGTFWFSLFARV